jgi:type I restriction enzyme S subunit
MFVRTQDINTNALVNYDQIARVSLPEKVEGKRTLIRRDDILITITGANVGKCAYVRAEIPEAYVSQSVALVRLKEPSLAAYLQRQLISPAEGSSSTSLEQSAYGLGRPVLSLDDVREAPIRLAPLKEQRRIVAKIDSLSGKSKRARDHLDHVPRLVQKYKEAILQTAFSAGLTDAADKNTFAPIVFSEIVASTFYGPRISSDAYVESGIPTLRTTDISDWGRLILRSPPQVQVTESDFAKWGLQDQDLIVTRTGATIGKCAIYEKAIGPALPSAYLIRVRLLLDRIDAKYALLFLLSPDGQRQLLAGRTAVAQPNINAGAICAVKLPLPKLEVQRELVHRIHSAFAWIDRLASEATSARKLINHLDQAILSKAFRGELVPQDPNDEPASVLLKKIRGEKVKEPGKKRGRR